MATSETPRHTDKNGKRIRKNATVLVGINRIGGYRVEKLTHLGPYEPAVSLVPIDCPMIIPWVVACWNVELAPAGTN